LRLGFDLAFGVHGKLLTSYKVGSDEGCLDVLSGFTGNNKSAEVEMERPGAAEAVGGFGLGDGSDDRGTLWKRDGVVRVVDRFGDDGFDLLAGFGGGGA
jgi:hypothetical protein